MMHNISKRKNPHIDILLIPEPWWHKVNNTHIPVTFKGWCQSHAVAELSMRGSGNSRGFWCSSSEYTWTPRIYKAGRDRLQRLRGERCAHSAHGVSQISGSGLDLLGGILKSILELKYKGS